jgi:beta-lactamase regulating signal transducer with metallopeptidase domain
MMGGIGDPTSVWAVAPTAGIAWLLTYAAHSTLLLGLAWLCARCLRPYRLKEIIWKTALVGGILTATLQVALGISPLTGQLDLLPSEAAQLELEQLSTFEVTFAPPGTDDVPISRETLPLPAADVAPGTDSGGQSSSQDIHATALKNNLTSTLRTGAGWLLAFWVVGSAVAILKLGHARRRLYAALKERRDIRDDSLANIFARLCMVTGPRKPVRLTYSSRISSPMTLSCREICLPRRAVTQLNAGQQESLLAHELAHVMRRDPLWLSLSLLLQCLFFFQPLHRLARQRIQECAEYLADDQATRYTGSGLTLARCLVEVAGWPSRHALPAPTAGIVGNTSSLERRVRRLLDSTASHRETPRWWWAIIAVSILVIVAGAGPGISAKASVITPEPAKDNTPWQVVRILTFDRSVAMAGFFDETAGIITAHNGSVHYTTDGGSTWGPVENQCMTSESATCVGLDMVDGQVAWHCANANRICVTANGGQTWKSVTEEGYTYPDQCRFLSFLDAQTGWSATPNRLMATSDGGATWIQIDLPEDLHWIIAATLPTATDGYLLDANGLLFVTNDGGKTWDSRSLELEEGEKLFDQCNSTTTMRFLDADHGIVIFSSIVNGQTGKTVIARTSDGGQTWQREQLPPIPEVKGSIYYHHLAHDGRTLTITGTDGRQVAVLRHQEP